MINMPCDSYRSAGDDVSDPLQGAVRVASSIISRKVALDPGPVQSGSELDHSSLVHGMLLLPLPDINMSTIG